METENPPKAEPQVIRLADYTPPAYRIVSVDLAFDLEPAATRVKATTIFEADHDRAKGIKPLELDGEGLKLISIAVDGEPLGNHAYELNERGITIALPP